MTAGIQNNYLSSTQMTEIRPAIIAKPDKENTIKVAFFDSGELYLLIRQLISSGKILLYNFLNIFKKFIIGNGLCFKINNYQGSECQ